MNGPSLELQGGGIGGWLGVLLAALVLLLLANSAWLLLVRRRPRAALLSLAAALGPLALVPTLTIDAVLRRRHDRAGAGTSLWGAIGAAALLAGGVAIYGIAPSASAGWMVLTTWWVVLAVGAFYGGVYAYLGTRRLAALLLLRCLAIAALVALLFKPALSFPPPRAGQRPVLSILVDRSGSMATADYPGVPNRYQQAVGALASQAGRIERELTPVWHPFAAGMQSVAGPSDLSGLKPSGEGTDATDIALAIRRSAEEYRRGDLAGILLLSDGIQTTSESLSDAATEAGVPIYAIGLGLSEASLPGRVNARVLNVDAPLEAIKNNQCTLTARVQATGLMNRGLRMRLTQAGAGGGETELAGATLTPAGAETTESVKLTFIPSDENAPAGAKDAIRRLTVRVNPSTGESLTDDNDAEVHILVTEPRIRVLYIESIRPEYKYLSAQLRQDPNVQLVTLVHLSASQFVVSGSIAGMTLSGLPSSTQDLSAFDAVILGDVDSSFWTREQLTLLTDFVRSGKGLLMLGGRNTFGPGGYGATALQDILPVVCGGRTAGQEATPFVPQLTADGVASPLLSDTQEFLLGPGGTPAKYPVPQLTGCVRTGGLRPGATALAIHPTRQGEGGPLIVLASQQVGQGRVVAFTADTTWRWHLELEGRRLQSPYARFWQQMVRYLSNIKIKEQAAAASVLARTERTFLESGQTLHVLARVQGTEGVTSEAAVSVSVAAAGSGGEPSGGAAAPAALEASASQGIFEGTLSPGKSGRYVLQCTAMDKAGKEIGKDALPLIVASPSVESERLGRDEAALQELANRSQGMYADIRGLPDVVDRIIDRSRGLADAPRSPTTFRLYNFTLGFLLFVGLMTLEWSLRRSWQLQ